MYLTGITERQLPGVSQGGCRRCSERSHARKAWRSPIASAACILLSLRGLSSAHATELACIREERVTSDCDYIAVPQKPLMNRESHS